MATVTSRIYSGLLVICLAGAVAYCFGVARLTESDYASSEREKYMQNVLDHPLNL